ncbi:Transforming growth factor-beta-induced protein ig-h3 [Vanrija pseudolonga]|uniref:Transforming growth factor-beta-induced protein ig-h3 n=1 Tax=Vanrija pseudolonga TaxID=143232 RepID=A0AAF0YER6_9TREE|nr:Transforming growth factor-beta-induced protein ig-h3 [Vanrija pseudolonga]
MRMRLSLASSASVIAAAALTTLITLAANTHARPLVNLDPTDAQAPFEASSNSGAGAWWDHHSVVGGAADSLTIWGRLTRDDNYAMLVRVLEFEQDTIALLDDPDAQITLFAPSNDALRGGGLNPSAPSTLPDLAAALSAPGAHVHRARWKNLAHNLLRYHIVPSPAPLSAIARNSTLPTALKPFDGSGAGIARRIHVEHSLVPLRPALRVNWWAKVVSSAPATNGYLHTLDQALVPPSSVFEEMFLVSRYLSTTTTAIQRAGLDLGWEDGEGEPLVTAFAPSNDAWNALPADLHYFLFSRKGNKALKKLLKYHTAPGVLLLSEVVAGAEAEGEVKADGTFKRVVELESGSGEQLQVTLEKARLLPINGAVKTSVKINGVKARLIDVPATNGAWHMIDKVLVPPARGASPRGGWADWQLWLDDWASSA